MTEPTPEALKSALVLAEETIDALQQELATERAAHALTRGQAEQAAAALHAERMRVYEFARQVRATIAKGDIDG
jgi:hypothetical protein